MFIRKVLINYFKKLSPREVKTFHNQPVSSWQSWVYKTCLVSLRGTQCLVHPQHLSTPFSWSRVALRGLNHLSFLVVTARGENA